MPVRSEVDSTTTSGGTTTVDGTVVDDGPGGLAGFQCDVLVMIDGEKLRWVGPSSPSADLYREDKTAIYVWWRDVAIPKDPGVDFQVPVEWKSGAKGFAMVILVAFDDTQKVVSHDVVWLKKPKKGMKGLKGTTGMSGKGKSKGTKTPKLPKKVLKGLKKAKSKKKAKKAG